MSRVKRLTALALVLFLLANALPALAWEKPGKHIAKGLNFVVAVQGDGTVRAAGDNAYSQCDVQDWRDVVAVAAGYDHALGLKKDGTVYAAGNNEYGQCSVSGWKDIVMVTATLGGSYGLTGDGRVLHTHNKPSLGKTEMEKWRDIVWIDSRIWDSPIAIDKEGRPHCVSMDITWISDVRQAYATFQLIYILKNDGSLLYLPVEEEDRS